MATRQLQINALITAIADDVRRGGNAGAAATATGLRRVIWADAHGRAVGAGIGCRAEAREKGLSDGA